MMSLCMSCKSYLSYKKWNNDECGKRGKITHMDNIKGRSEGKRTGRIDPMTDEVENVWTNNDRKIINSCKIPRVLGIGKSSLLNNLKRILASIHIVYTEDML